MTIHTQSVAGQAHATSQMATQHQQPSSQTMSAGIPESNNNNNSSSSNNSTSGSTGGNNSYNNNSNNSSNTSTVTNSNNNNNSNTTYSTNSSSSSAVAASAASSATTPISGTPTTSVHHQAAIPLYNHSGMHTTNLYVPTGGGMHHHGQSHHHLHHQQTTAAAHQQLSGRLHPAMIQTGNSVYVNSIHGGWAQAAPAGPYIQAYNIQGADMTGEQALMQAMPIPMTQGSMHHGGGGRGGSRRGGSRRGGGSGGGNIRRNDYNNRYGNSHGGNHHGHHGQSSGGNPTHHIILQQHPQAELGGVQVPITLMQPPPQQQQQAGMHEHHHHSMHASHHLQHAAAAQQQQQHLQQTQQLEGHILAQTANGQLVTTATPGAAGGAVTVPAGAAAAAGNGGQHYAAPAPYPYTFPTYFAPQNQLIHAGTAAAGGQPAGGAQFFLSSVPLYSPHPPPPQAIYNYSYVYPPAASAIHANAIDYHYLPADEAAMAGDDRQSVGGGERMTHMWHPQPLYTEEYAEMPMNDLNHNPAAYAAAAAADTPTSMLSPNYAIYDAHGNELHKQMAGLQLYADPEVPPQMQSLHPGGAMQQVDDESALVTQQPTIVAVPAGTIIATTAAATLQLAPSAGHLLATPLDMLPPQQQHPLSGEMGDQLLNNPSAEEAAPHSYVTEYAAGDYTNTNEYYECQLAAGDKQQEVHPPQRQTLVADVEARSKAVSTTTSANAKQHIGGPKMPQQPRKDSSDSMAAASVEGEAQDTAATKGAKVHGEQQQQGDKKKTHRQPGTTPPKKTSLLGGEAPLSHATGGYQQQNRKKYTANCPTSNDSGAQSTTSVAQPSKVWTNSAQASKKSVASVAVTAVPTAVESNAKWPRAAAPPQMQRTQAKAAKSPLEGGSGTDTVVAAEQERKAEQPTGPQKAQPAPEKAAPSGDDAHDTTETKASSAANGVNAATSTSPKQLAQKNSNETGAAPAVVAAPAASGKEDETPKNSQPAAETPAAASDPAPATPTAPSSVEPPASDNVATSSTATSVTVASTAANPPATTAAKSAGQSWAGLFSAAKPVTQFTASYSGAASATPQAGGSSSTANTSGASSPALPPLKGKTAAGPAAKEAPKGPTSKGPDTGDAMPSKAGVLSYSAASAQGLATSRPKVVKPATATNTTSGAAAATGANSKSSEVTHKFADFLATYSTDLTPTNLRPRGLTNRSNYCYINATLQALLGCSPFYNLVRSIPKYAANASGIKTPTVNAMISFMNHFSNMPSGLRLRSNQKGKGKEKDDLGVELQCDLAFEPTEIYKLWNETREGHVEGRQEDAEEFLGYVLNKLNDEMLEVMKTIAKPQPAEQNGQNDQESENESWQVICNNRNKGSVTRQTDFGRTPLSDIFRGELRSRLHREGEVPTDVIQPFFTLQLNIEKAASVKEALDILVGRNQIEGVTGIKSKQEVMAWQQMTLEKLPMILILHLKWFDYKSDGCSKILRKVEFPVELKIDSKILAKRHAQKLRVYRLFAIVYHDGRDTTNGHYVSDVYHSGYQSWLRYDDSTVKPVLENHVLQPRTPRVPYLLYYRRCDTLPQPPAAANNGGGSSNSGSSNSVNSNNNNNNNNHGSGSSYHHNSGGGGAGSSNTSSSNSSQSNHHQSGRHNMHHAK